MDKITLKLFKLDGLVGETGETFSERIKALLEYRRLNEILEVF